MFHHTEIRITMWVPDRMDEVRQRGEFTKPYFQEYMKARDWSGLRGWGGKTTDKCPTR